jgi:ADP-heptose:LPS heptosyltransferase
MPHSSPSVLVIRLDAIGDALALTPLLAALRERGIPTDVVLRGVNAQVFSSRAARAVFVAPFALRSSTRANRDAILEFGSLLSRNRYSHVLVATEDPGGYRLAHAVGAPERIGFTNGWGKPLKSLWVRSLLTRTIVRSAGLDARAPHECEVLFELGASLLADERPTRDLQRLRPLVLEADVARGERIAFQVTDKWERLGIAFDDVVRAIANARERGTVRAIASETEARYAQRFAKSAGINVERFASLEPWKEAIASAAALVAPDSGALHVAGMVGTPSVAVFPVIRDAALQTARWSPWAAPARLLLATPQWPEGISEALAALR